MTRSAWALLLLALAHLQGALCQAGALSGVLSSYQCYEEHPKFDDQRVCVFENLVVLNGELLFVTSTAGTQLPKIIVSWEKKYDGDQWLRIRSITPEQLPAPVGEVKVVSEAGLFHQQHPNNYYHLFTEIAPTVHYTVCKYLQRCKYQKHDTLRLYWVNDLSYPAFHGTVTYRTPAAIADLFECLTPHPVLNIHNATVTAGQTLLLKKAVVGLPRNARFYHQKKTEWQERWQDPPPLEHMLSYRQRVSDCLDLDLTNRVAPMDPLRITFINRHYEDGRHILNAERLRDRIRELPAVRALGAGRAEVNVVYLEGSLREQAAIIANTSIYLWAHGAAMAQTFFLPRGAQALEIVQWVVADPSDQHVWVQGIRTAFDLPIGLDVLVNDDPTKVFFNYDAIRSPGSQYYKFNDTEKVLLMEQLKCPTWRDKERGINGLECFGWFHWHMSLVLKWELLQPKIEAAIGRLQVAVAALRPAYIARSALGVGPGAGPVALPGGAGSGADPLASLALRAVEALGPEAVQDLARKSRLSSGVGKRRRRRRAKV